jgi:hypothetical protein
MLRITSALKPCIRTTIGSIGAPLPFGNNNFNMNTINNASLISISSIGVRSIATPSSSSSSSSSTSTPSSTSSSNNSKSSKKSVESSNNSAGSGDSISSTLDSLFGNSSIASTRLTNEQQLEREAARKRLHDVLSNEAESTSAHIQLIATTARDEARLKRRMEAANKSRSGDELELSEESASYDEEPEIFRPPKTKPHIPVAHPHNLFRAYYDTMGNPLPLVGYVYHLTPSYTYHISSLLLLIYCVAVVYISPNEPRPRWPIIDKYGRAQGTGRRKTSVVYTHRDIYTYFPNHP